MDSEDEFPFDSIDQFEEAVQKYEEKEKLFATVPPIYCKETFNEKKIPTWVDVGANAMQDGVKSPQTRTVNMIKDLQAQLNELECKIALRLEQLESLYYFLHDKLNNNT